RSGEVAQVMKPAMNVGVFLAVGALNGIEHKLRLLRRGAVVEIDEGAPMDLLRQDREVGADGIDVVGNRSGALLSKGFRQDRHGYSPSVETDAEPIGRRLGQRLAQ